MKSAIDPRVQIGHIHLKVSDIEQSLTFYCKVLGFEITQRIGSSAAFISAGGCHHHIRKIVMEKASIVNFRDRTKKNQARIYSFLPDDFRY